MEKYQGSKGRDRKPVIQVLESGTLDGIRLTKNAVEERLKFEWSHYSEIARQRNAIQDPLKQSLVQKSIPYQFENFQRSVKYKYSLHPLSVAGSLSYVGGRFNIGKNINSELQYFPGLYLAYDKDTALQEHLGQEPIKSGSSLTPRDLALTNPSSETIVSVSGKLDKVFDLTNLDNLSPFVDLIKGFKISKDFTQHARRLNFHLPLMVKTKKQLIQSLLALDWRRLPSMYDIPANSQIFGHLVYSAGIEGILYTSKFTGKNCLVIFPRNFVGTDSFIEIDDEPPHKIVPKRLNASNWRASEMSLEEISGA